ncbi:MAG: hypothetical protein Phog2KO_26450 [Phototrophicaceae bacterium]
MIQKSYPNEDWILGDWFQALKVKSDADFADKAMELGVTEDDKPWTPQQINIIKNGTKTRAPGIRKRDLALDYLVVLKSFADANNIELFAPERIEHTVNLFLRSQACREKFASPNDSEFLKFFHYKPTQKSTHKGINILRNQVQPALPPKLFGRSNDLLTVGQALNDCSVVLIDGIAGNGKTTLAWHSAVELYEKRIFTDFDWTTDKRHIVNDYGHLVPLEHEQTPETFLTKLLVSLCRQFSWVDLLAAQDEQLINACADRLRMGRYLIVVDNLESLENSEAIVRQLSDMLSPIGRFEPLSSRALITSRQRVTNPNVALVSIDGIDELERVAYINFLQDMWKVKKRLTDSHAQEIARLTSGNPLFIQLAMRRYALMPSTIDQILADIAVGKHQAFNSLFQPLLDVLKPETLCFAINLAYELSVSEATFEIEDLVRIWQGLNTGKDLDYSQFSIIIGELVNNRIVNLNDIEGYSMHPLVRSFLMSQDDDISQSACQ